MRFFWLREDYKVENSLKRHFISVLNLKNDYTLRFKTSKGKLIKILLFLFEAEMKPIQFNIFNALLAIHLLSWYKLITSSTSQYHISFLFSMPFFWLLVTLFITPPVCLLHVWQIHFLFSLNSCWRIFVAFTLSSPSCWDIKISSWRLKPFALKKNISQDCQFLALHQNLRNWLKENCMVIIIMAIKYW